MVSGDIEETDKYFNIYKTQNLKKCPHVKTHTHTHIGLFSLNYQPERLIITLMVL